MGDRMAPSGQAEVKDPPGTALPWGPGLWGALEDTENPRGGKSPLSSGKHAGLEKSLSHLPNIRPIHGVNSTSEMRGLWRPSSLLPGEEDPVQIYTCGRLVGPPSQDPGPVHADSKAKSSSSAGPMSVI